MTSPPWLQVLQGLLTPVIAMFAVYIAYQQHKTARERLRLDLYNKRFSVYEALRDLLALIAREARVDLKHIFEFTGKTRDADFLFGAEVTGYIEEVRRRAIDFRYLSDKLGADTLPAGPERDTIVEREHEHLEWFLGQFDIMQSMFRPYLRFGT